MSHSPYNPKDPRSAPNHQRESTEYIQERDQPWFESVTDQECRDFHREAWSEAYIFVGNDYEAEEIADVVIDELYRIPRPPSRAQIVGYIRGRAQWRAIDRLRSPRHHYWKHQLSLVGTTKDGDEYEVVPDPLLVDGAEETFLQELEATEQNRVTEQRLKQLHQAILNINDGELRVCFVLRHSYEMQPAAIAKMLDIPTELVYAHLRLAMAQVKTFMRKQEKEDAKKKEKDQKSLPP